jgi:hypothetical protein
VLIVLKSEGLNLLEPSGPVQACNGIALPFYYYYYYYYCCCYYYYCYYKHDLEKPGVDGRIIIKWIFGSEIGTRIALIWLRIGTGSGLL